MSSGLRACPIALSGLAALGFLVVLSVLWLSRHVETIESTISETALASVSLYHLSSAAHGTDPTEAHGHDAGMAALHRETGELRKLMQRLAVYFEPRQTDQGGFEALSFDEMAYRSGLLAMPEEMHLIWNGADGATSVPGLLKDQFNACTEICMSPDMPAAERSAKLAALNDTVVNHLLPRLKDMRSAAAAWQLRLHYWSKIVIAGALLCIIASILFTRFRVVQPLLRELGSANASLAKENDKLEQVVAQRTEHLRIALDRAEAANEARSRFLAAVNHEMRTPLNGVLGVAALLRSTLLDRKQQGLVETIANSGQIMVNLIDDVMDYVSLNDGEKVLIPTSISIAQVVRECLDILRPAANAKGLFLYCFTGKADHIMVRTDPDCLREVLSRLVGNAIRFTEEGGITVRLEQTVLGDLAEVAIAVEDTGEGIEADRLDRLFEPFDRPALGVPGDGSGLGLAVARSLVAEMSGELTVESHPGRGSCFHVILTLPLVRAVPGRPAHAA